MIMTCSSENTGQQIASSAAFGLCLKGEFKIVKTVTVHAVDIVREWSLNGGRLFKIKAISLERFAFLASDE